MKYNYKLEFKGYNRITLNDIDPEDIEFHRFLRYLEKHCELPTMECKPVAVEVKPITDKEEDDF